MLFPSAANPLGADEDEAGFEAKEESLFPAAAAKGEAEPDEPIANGEAVDLAKLPKPELLKASSEVCTGFSAGFPAVVEVCGLGAMVAKGEMDEVFANPLPVGI